MKNYFFILVGLSMFIACTNEPDCSGTVVVQSYTEFYIDTTQLSKYYNQKVLEITHNRDMQTYEPGCRRTFGDCLGDNLSIKNLTPDTIQVGIDALAGIDALPGKAEKKFGKIPCNDGRRIIYVKIK